MQSRKAKVGSDPRRETRSPGTASTFSATAVKLCRGAAAKLENNKLPNYFEEITRDESSAEKKGDAERASNSVATCVTHAD